MAFKEIGGRWEPDDPQRISFDDRVMRAFPHMSPAGKQAALSLQLSLLNPERPTPATPQLPIGIRRILVEAARVPDSAIRRQALLLAEALAGHTNNKDSESPFRELLEASLTDNEAETRVEAIRVASNPAINMLRSLGLSLRDANPEVRQAAILAVGPAPEAIATDDLLPLLHDPDTGVRRICEKALRGRGLRDNHLRLARLITDVDPRKRLEVLEYVCIASDLEPGAWLRRMSHDPVPAVRAAAIRAAADDPHVDLSDRLDQLARNDPSSTVRQLAGYHLERRRSKENRLQN
jgi:HEAT repeat protein